MRRADRLFQIIQILRRSSSPITAAAIAAELETSGPFTLRRRRTWPAFIERAAGGSGPVQSGTKFIAIPLMQ
jgi:hypothetical protein